MNLTTDQYLQSLEKSANNWPGVAAEWAQLDEDLQEEYLSSLWWLLEQREHVLGMAGIEGRTDVQERIDTAVATLRQYMWVP